MLIIGYDIPAILFRGVIAFNATFTSSIKEIFLEIVLKILFNRLLESFVPPGVYQRVEYTIEES